MSEVEVVPVRSRREQREFLNYPWKLYRDDPYWIPPLRRTQREMTGFAPHPFYEAAEIQTFLARRNGATVGRIAAILNHAYNREFSSDPLGFFGFFESIDDPHVANGLFDAARAWLAERGIDTIRGPANPSMNYECGLLIDGFDSSPTFMMTYNPPYYAALIENYGFRKSHDLLGFIGYMTQMPEVEERVSGIAEMCMERYGVSVRPMDRRRFEQDVELFLKLYNSSMVLTWGFVPISSSEMRHMASSLKMLLHPELAIIAEVDGKPAGVVLCLPDYNPRIKEIDGKLFPFGFLRLLSPRKDIRRVRVIAISVLPEYQRVGVGLVLMNALVPAARELNIEEAEFSYVAESNDLARLGLEKGGARLYKTWRMYDLRPEQLGIAAR
jgi:GNAT superfamily N-acetyltransferase